MPEPIELLNATAMQHAFNRIAHEIAERNPESRGVVLLGVQSGGVHFAQRLATALAPIFGHAVPTGSLDVTMHRDDLDQRAAPIVHPSQIPCDLNGKIVILVDDVLFSGRTTRAAMDAKIGRAHV